MQCPNDQTILTMTERHGVEIDYCPQCRGVWLDRGELDKMIDRASGGTVHQMAAQPGLPVTGSPQPAMDYRDRSHSGHDSRREPHKKRKESFLSDLFDF